jgi:hypothetical protein
MKSSITLTVLGILIILLAGFATLNGLISSQPAEPMTTTSVFGEQVQLHGKGLYRRDSVSAAAQAQAQDAVTLLVGIPLLVISLAWARKGAMGGKLLLAGTLAYFLYTYTSMTFLSFYNQLFLVYVALFSLSLFALVLAFQQVDVESLPDRFSDRLPVKWIAGFLFFLSFMLLFMWMGRIVPSLDGRTPPVGLEHYTTLHHYSHCRVGGSAAAEKEALGVYAFGGNAVEGADPAAGDLRHDHVHGDGRGRNQPGGSGGLYPVHTDRPGAGGGAVQERQVGGKLN